MVDIGAHLPGAAGTPSPDARADIIYDRDIRAALAHPFSDRMGEFWAVDDDEQVWIEGKRRVHGAVHAPDELWKPRKDGGGSHDRHVRKWKNRANTRSLHILAADPREFERFAARLFLQRP